MRTKTVTTATPFSGLGFDLADAALAADGMRLERRHEDTNVFMVPRPAPQCPQWGFELMVFLGRETGGS